MPGFESLRLPPGVETLAEEHRGLILVTGATGAGKTTTLAAMVGHINRTRRQHIVTIEDPIEILHDDATCIVNQREVGIDTESFDEALRRVLRQDPDVILIGELRDSETAETALQAAESGHLVLSTMHTVDASETLGRLVEFFPAIKQPQVRSILAGVLKGVVSQRLLPRAGGGRIAAVEVMVANSRIQELIRENKPEFVPEAIAEGAFFQMQTLTKALIDLVVSGDVDEETAAAAAPNRHDFMIALGRALKEHAVQESAEAAKGAEPEESAVPDGARAARGTISASPDARARDADALALRRARLHVRRAAEAQDGFTLVEMLVVLAIIGSHPGRAHAALHVCDEVPDRPDEPHAGAAGREARPRQASPGDPLRERRHDAERLPGVGDHDHARKLLPDRRWSRHDGDVVHQGQERHLTAGRRGAALHALAIHRLAPARAPGRQWASDLVDKSTRRASPPARSSTPPPFRPRRSLRRRRAGRWPPGTYSYDVTAVLAGGVEVSGDGRDSHDRVRADQQDHASAGRRTRERRRYNVYGRDGGGLRLLKNVTSGTSYVDTGPTTLTDLTARLTLPSATIPVADTSNFNSGANTIAFGASGLVTCTGTTSTSFTGCSGGQAGTVSARARRSTARRARARRARRCSVSLAVDMTPASASQRFVLIDNIVLRNSQPF